MTEEQIVELTKLFRLANQDEFQDNITHENTIESLYIEGKNLAEKHIELKERAHQIIDHLSSCFDSVFYVPVKKSKKDDLLDTICMAFDTFIEEYEAQIVSKNYFFNVINRIPQNVIVFDFNGKVEFTNQKWKDFFKSKITFENKRTIDFLPKDLIENINKFKSSDSFFNEFEYQLFETPTSSTPLLCTLSKIESLNKKHILLVAIDISSQKNQELNILRATMEGQDHERKRLANDLHDSLGQELNAMKMYINAMSMMKKNSTTFNRSLDIINKILADSISSVQDISFDLMPVVLERNCLNDSLSQLTNRINLVYSKIEFKAPKTKIKLRDKRNELFVYRIVQEFLNNSVKYSKANLIIVKLSANKKHKTVSILLKDNGVGFNINKQKSRNGVYNIKQRLGILKADYTYKSKEGIGTELFFTIYE